MKKGLYIAALMLVVAMAAVFVVARVGQNRERKVLENNKELLLVHNKLVQNRILLVQLLTTDSAKNFEINELLSYLETESKDLYKLAGDYMQREDLKRHKPLFEKTETYLIELTSFAENANKNKTADRDEAISLLTDLTNLILEYRFELERSGYQFPPLSPLPSR